MSLPLYALNDFRNMIHPELQKLENPSILLLSYPDLIANPKHIANMFGLKMHQLKIRPDSKKIIDWHKAHAITEEIVDTVELFKTLGYKVTVTDIVVARDCEVFLDLNKPLPPGMYEKYDFIFENCLDHCFNIGQGFMNLLELVSYKGFIMHLNPLLMINHGFWSMSPTAYHDWYNHHKFDILHYKAFKGIQQIQFEYVMNSPYIRLKDIMHDSMQMMIVQNNNAIKAPVTMNQWPTQYKFQKFPNSTLI